MDDYMSPMFVLDQELDNPCPWNRLRIILEKPKSERSELEKHLLRALSWIRQAKFVRNTIRELLFLWIAMEVLLKEQRDESVAPKALLTTGFPVGEIFQRINPEDRRKLRAFPKYKTWQKELQKRFEEIQDLRNFTVHEGFREVDLAEANCRYPLNVYLSLMRMAAPRTASFACVGIALQCQTITELWQRKGEVYLKHSPNPACDILENVIFSLEYPPTD